MKSFLLYTLQVIFISGVLSGFYSLFLRNRQFHQYNRFYLLLASVAALVIPCIKIPYAYARPLNEASPAVVRLLETIYIPEAEVQAGTAAIIEPHTSIDWWMAALVTYLAVVAVMITFLLIGSIKVRRLAGFYGRKKMGDIYFVNTDAPGTPFSFFNWLFWDENVPLHSAKGRQMFRHELFHIRQKHSWDIMFMQVLTAVYWINPFFYLIRKELRVIHEFLADEYASVEEGEQAYAELLLVHALQCRQKLVNPFFQTQIKRRIAMITQTKTNSRRYARKLLVLPFIALLTGLVAFRIEPVARASEDAMTIIVDAGHGGFDPGAKSPDNKYEEASMTLELARLMQKLAPEYGIRVVLTRETNDAVGATKKEDLQNRLTKSKAVKPAVFLSIHINATGKPGEFQDKRSGFEATVASKRDDPAAKLIASAMLQRLSGIYSAAMQIRQRQDAGVYVLDQNICPSILLQCGFINNEKDLAFFTNKDNQEKVVRTLLEVLKAQVK
jgi:N-acetylmuramoyl-L-alanine amidase